MNYLTVEQSETTDGITTLELMASTTSAQHAAALAEAQQVLDWSWRRFPHSHGPAEEGHDWDHDLQVVAEADGWHTVTLTLTGSPHYVDELHAAFQGFEQR